MRIKVGFLKVFEESLVYSSRISSITVISIVILILPFTIGNGPFLDINPSYIGFFAAALILFFEIENILTHKRKLESNYFLPSILFIVSVYLSMFLGFDYTSNPNLTLYDITFPAVIREVTKRIVAYSLLSFLIYISIKDLKDVKKLIHTFLISGILINLFSFFLLLSSSGTIKGRFTSVFEDPNMLGRFEVFIIIICVCLILLKRKNFFEFTFLVFNIIVCLYFQFLTYSRSSFISLSVIIVILFFLFSKSRLVKYLFLLMVILGLFFVLSKFSILRSVPDSQATAVGLLDYSNLARILLNIVGVEMFLEKPIFGVGFLNYYNVYMNHSNYYEQFPMISQLPVIHSWLIAVMAELGLLGIVSLSWLLLLAFRDLFNSIRRSLQYEKIYGVVIFSLLFVLVFNGLFYWYFIMELIFPVFLGILLGYVKIILNRKVLAS
jgi:O-antigen ligase